MFVMLVEYRLSRRKLLTFFNRFLCFLLNKFNTFLNVFSLIEPGPTHPGGYHFAINSDIAMFRVYSSSQGEFMGCLVIYG